MRKNVIRLGVMMAAILSFTNCVEKLPVEPGVVEPEAEKFPYTIQAKAVDTKTANSDMTTTWVANDALSVFFAATGSTEYNGQSHFVIKNVTDGLFETQNLVGNPVTGTNDWFAVYPYDASNTTPTAVKVKIGAGEQTTAGNTDHIAGAGVPVAGKKTGVEATDLPGIQLSHLTALIKLVITNDTGEKLTVSNVGITATEEISGDFQVDITGDSPAYTKLDGASTTASVTVSNVEVANGATAEFYLVTKPFTAVSGTALSFSVNGKSITKTLSQAIAFNAGEITTLKFKYDVRRSLYERYNSGADIVIGDKTINKTTCGEAVLVTKSAPTINVNTSKIFFVDADANAEFNVSGTFNSLIILGNTEGTRSKLNVKSQLKVGTNSTTEDDFLLISGIELDATTFSGNLLAQNKAFGYGYVHFNDCLIKLYAEKCLIYSNDATKYYKKIVMTGCEMPIGNKNNIIALSTTAPTYDYLKFENNIFYNSSSDAVTDFRIFNGSSATVTSLVFNNNTLYNLQTSPADKSALGAVYVSVLTGIEATKNIFYTNIQLQNYLCLVYATTYPADSSGLKENISYASDLNSKTINMYQKNTSTTNYTNAEALDSDPYTGGNAALYKPNATYASYGAQR